MSTNIWLEKEIKELLKELAHVGTEAEVATLLGVINTPREINDMAKRLKIRKLLERGESYSSIGAQLGVSPVIISRISNSIGYGFRRSYAKIGSTAKNKKPKKRIRLRPSLPKYWNI